MRDIENPLKIKMFSDISVNKRVYILHKYKIYQNFKTIS